MTRNYHFMLVLMFTGLCLIGSYQDEVLTFLDKTNGPVCPGMLFKSSNFLSSSWKFSWCWCKSIDSSDLLECRPCLVTEQFRYYRLISWNSRGGWWVSAVNLPNTHFHRLSAHLSQRWPMLYHCIWSEIKQRTYRLYHKKYGSALYSLGLSSYQKTVMHTFW